MELSIEDCQLKRKLSGIAVDLKWTAVELARISVRLNQSGNDPDSQALLRIIKGLREDEESLEALGELVQARRLGYKKTEISSL